VWLLFLFSQPYLRNHPGLKERLCCGDITLIFRHTPSLADCDDSILEKVEALKDSEPEVRPFSFPDPPVPLSRRGPGTRKRLLSFARVSNFSGQSAGRNSNTSGTGSVRISAQGFVYSWSKLSPKNIARPKILYRPDYSSPWVQGYSCPGPTGLEVRVNESGVKQESGPPTETVHIFSKQNETRCVYHLTAF